MDSTKALTAKDLAEALGHFWNAALRATHQAQDATANAVMSGMVEGIAAVQAALAEQGEAPAADGWRTMDSAPENEPILVWVPKIHRGRDSAEVIVIYRHEPDVLYQRGYTMWTNGGSNGGDDMEFEYAPTHWRPLPASPAASQAPAANRWRPIETAPKDGTLVLLAKAGDDDWPLRCRRWQDTHWRGWDAEDATHWMPLPASPNAASQEGSE